MPYGQKADGDHISKVFSNTTTTTASLCKWRCYLSWDTTAV